MNMTPFARVPILLAFLGLASCASVGPDYTPPTLDLPAAWNRLSDATNASTAKDLAQWWRNLNDPLLSELVEGALRTSPDLRAAQDPALQRGLERTLGLEPGGGERDEASESEDD